MSPEGCRTRGGEHGEEAGTVPGRTSPVAAALPPTSAWCPERPCCLGGLLTAPSAHPAHGEGARGCSVPLSIPAWLIPWHSRHLCSIAALAVGGLGCGVSPALLHASFGPFCGPSAIPGTPVIPCAAWSSQTAGSGGCHCRASTFPFCILTAVHWLLLPGPLWEPCPCTAGVSSTGCCQV